MADDVSLARWSGILATIALFSQITGSTTAVARWLRHPCHQRTRSMLVSQRPHSAQTASMQWRLGPHESADPH